MFSSTLLSIFVLTLTTLSSALPPVKRDTCNSPQTFTITGFTSFYPAAGNPNNQTSTFEFGDSATTNEIRCTISGPPTPNTLTPCSDASVSFSYNGTETEEGVLKVRQEVENCTRAIHGSVWISTYCYPAEVPFGLGTDCQIPSVSLTGEF